MRLVPRTTPPPPPVDGAVWVALSQGKFALVDEGDATLIRQHRWYFVKAKKALVGYAFTHVNRRMVYMHQMVWQAMGRKKHQLDHKDRNSLNNRRGNLRAATSQQNHANRARQANGTSGYKGVYLNRQLGKWQAKIHFKGKQIYKGLFADPADAARAYDRAAKELYGEFACLNFSEEAQVG